MRSNKDIFAIALIVIGLLLIVQIFNIPFISEFNLGNIIGILWPLFLLIPGLNMLKERFNFGGLILTVIGGSFLVENLLELIGVNFEGTIIFKFFWPAVLIYIGFKLLTREKSVKYDDDIEFGESGFRDYEEETNNAGTAGIMFGSKTYKYTLSDMPDGVTTLGLNITFGGADIIVEEGIQVVMVGQYSLGGYEFFDSEGGGVHNEIKEYRYPDIQTDYDKTLIIKTNISFGGIEVKTR